MFKNKREELEYEISDRNLYENAKELNHTEVTLAWPFVPLLGATKAEYKPDKVYPNYLTGDEPIDFIEKLSDYPQETNNSPNHIYQNKKNFDATNLFLADTSFSPIEIYWKNLSILASFKDKKKGGPPCCREKKNKILLNNITGIARPGTFTAIIGPSGGGKTTLLNFLSNRMMSSNLGYSGNIMINGQIVSNVNEIGNQVAYVMQDDILLATMTPKEVFEFSADLRIKGSKIEKNAKIDALIKMLNLESACNTYIGNNLIRGISGGERKRTSIGVELLTNPSLIFLDEPTTGLDSETALHVVEILKLLAENGRTVISTIHQPSSEIFMTFDKLILLVEGNIIYQGDAAKSIEYFKKMGYDSPPFCNPATFFMKCMNPEGLLVQSITKTGDYSIKLTDEIKNDFKKRLKSMIEYYRNSEDFNSIKPNSNASNNIIDKKMNTVSWIKQFYKIAGRGLQNELRNPMDVKMKTLSMIFFSILNIIVFTGLGNYKAEIQNRKGVIFSLIMNIGFGSIFANLLTFAQEKSLFIREKMNKTYCLSAYFWGRTSCEFPFHIFYPTLLVSITYFSIGLNNVLPEKFWIMVLICNVGYFAGVSYSFLLTAIFPKPEMAMALIPILIVPFLLLAGFFVNQNNIPYYFYEFEYLSIFKYIFQAAFINEFSDKIWYCAENVLCDPDPIDELNFAEDMWTCIWILAVIGLGTRMLAGLILMKMTTPERPKLMEILFEK